MKVSISWLKELVNLKVSIDKIIDLLPLRTIGTKDITADFFELDMKGYNRADLLSMRGVAYEVAAITDSKINFTEPDEKDFVWTNQNLPETQVEVKNPEFVPLYCIAKITGLRVGPPDKEWVEKLQDCGLRSVNNIADITNLVMLEYGQPLHAFDAQKVSGEKLIVRGARGGEEFVTLDEKIRRLHPSDLLIADPKKALALAGVMGGKNSEVTGSTTTIFLEAAIFDPVIIRKTAARLGLSSEASKRFQHGLTKKRLLQAFDAAIKMYEDVGGKLTAVSITGNLKDQQKSIELNYRNLNSLIGVEIPVEDVKKYLTKLNFKLQDWQAIPPYFRLDIEIEADIIEEVARMYGYENIPPHKLQGKLPDKIDQSLFDFIYELKATLVELGLTEIQTYSFYSTDVLNNLNFNKNNLIKVANPISAETEYLRDCLWSNLLEKVVQNLKQNFDQIAIFEIGKTYHSKEKSAPEEKNKLSLALSDNSPNSIQKLYSIFQKVQKRLGGKIELGRTEMDEEEKRLFHPVRFWQLTFDGKRIGEIAQIHPRIVNRFGVEKIVAVLEMEI